MKKILGIVVLGLLWSSNVYANENIENILENCADDRFINKTKLNKFTPELYLSKLKFQELEKESNSLKEKKKLVKGQFEKELQKWNEADLEKFKNIEMERFIDSNKAFTKRLEEVEKEVLSFIRSQASIFIKSEKFDLKFKAKDIDGYLSNYMFCEKEYLETPSSFSLRWSD